MKPVRCLWSAQDSPSNQCHNDAQYWSDNGSGQAYALCEEHATEWSKTDMTNCFNTPINEWPKRPIMYCFDCGIQETGQFDVERHAKACGLLFGFEPPTEEEVLEAQKGLLLLVKALNNADSD